MSDRIELISSAYDYDPVTHFYKCRWCPCIFCNLEDFIRHWKAIGKFQYDHHRKWKMMQEEAIKNG